MQKYILHVASRGPTVVDLLTYYIPAHGCVTLSYHTTMVNITAATIYTRRVRNIDRLDTELQVTPLLLHRYGYCHDIVQHTPTLQIMLYGVRRNTLPGTPPTINIVPACWFGLAFPLVHKAAAEVAGIHGGTPASSTA